MGLPNYPHTKRRPPVFDSSNFSNVVNTHKIFNPNLTLYIKPATFHISNGNDRQTGEPIITLVSHTMNAPSKPSDTVAEWLRRWTANPMGSARVGSNPILVVLFSPKTGETFNNNQKFPLPGIEPGPPG